jgi:hypothetical protein
MADVLNTLLDMLAPAVTAPKRIAFEPDRSRPMTAAEQTLYAAGALQYLSGRAVMLRGDAMQLAAQAAADPAFREIAQDADRSAQDAESEYRAEREKYARRVVQQDDGA